MTDGGVHCASGHRATTAASLLANAGGEVVLVDDESAPYEQSGAPASRTA
ncbi:hypothetical protein ACN27G_21510 [Plantactinospora sp. WMMB334]